MQRRASDLVIRAFMDMAVRYWPIVQYLRVRLHPSDVVLDVGSGSVGISPYLSNPVVGADLRFSGPPSALIPCRADITLMPFGDGAFPAVVCVDTLEHLRPAVREVAIAEIVRCAGRWAVIACPCGPESEKYDRLLDAYLRERIGASDAFLDEHLRFGLPRVDAIVRSVEAAAAALGRRVSVRTEPNVNLEAWYWIQKARANVVRRALVLAAFPVLFPVLRRRNRPPAYRQIVFCEFCE